MRLSSLVVVVALCACSDLPFVPIDSGRDGGGDAGLRDAGTTDGGLDGGLPMKSACLTLDSRRCDFLIRCGLLADSDAQRRECVSWLSATWCGPATWPSRADPHVGTLRYDPRAGAACALAWDTRDCSDWATLPAVCERLVSPAALAGQACYDGDLQCQSGVCRGGACPRLCQPAGASGEVCRVATDCRAPLYCRLSNVASGLGACTSPGTAGSLCTADEPCAAGFSCAAGHCLVAPEAGQSCVASLCDPGAWCQSGADGGLCLARSGVGEACTDDVQCLPELLCQGDLCTVRAVSAAGQPCSLRQQCPAPTTCVGASANSLGTCEVPRAADEPCATTSDCAAWLACSAGDGGLVCGRRHLDGALCAADRDCQVLSRCVAGTCTHLSSTGQGCESTRSCLLGPCAQQRDAGSVCAEPYGPGAACNSDGECASGRCVSGQCLFSCSP